MTDVQINPFAKGLAIYADSSGVLYFDFTVGEQIARVTLAATAIPEAISSFMRALTAESLQTIPPKGLPSGHHVALSVPAVNIGTSADQLSERVTVDFELPAQAQIHIELTTDDVRRLQESLAVALETALAAPSRVSH